MILTTKEFTTRRDAVLQTFADTEYNWMVYEIYRVKPEMRKKNANLLFLYLFVLDSWEHSNTATNYISEQQMMRLLSRANTLLPMNLSTLNIRLVSPPCCGTSDVPTVAGNPCVSTGTVRSTKKPLIQVAGRGLEGDPIVGLGTYQDNRLKGLSSNLIIYLDDQRASSFGQAATFNFDRIEGEITFTKGYTWQNLATLWIDLNQ